MFYFPIDSPYNVVFMVTTFCPYPSFLEPSSRQIQSLTTDRSVSLSRASFRFHSPPVSILAHHLLHEDQNYLSPTVRYTSTSSVLTGLATQACLPGFSVVNRVPFPYLWVSDLADSEL